MGSSTIWKSMLEKNKDLWAELVKNANISYSHRNILMISFHTKRKYFSVARGIRNRA